MGNEREDLKLRFKEVTDSLRVTDGGTRLRDRNGYDRLDEYVLFPIRLICLLYLICHLGP